MTRKTDIRIPKFKNEDAEADWWSSVEGRAFANQQSAKMKGSLKEGKAVTKLRNAGLMNTLISIRIPQADLEKARIVAERKGIPYQNYIKMVLHEALAKEN